MDELASSSSVPSIGLSPVEEWEGGVSDKGSGILVPPAFPRLYLALTVIQKSKTSESNLLVSGRSCFQLLGFWAISWGGLWESRPRGSSNAWGSVGRRRAQTAGIGDALVRRGRSAAKGWGLGAADSRDGWLRPLGGGEGPGSPRGWLAPRPRSRETAVKDDGKPEQHKDLLQSPSAPGKSLHPPQRVRSVPTAVGSQPLGPRFWGFTRIAKRANYKDFLLPRPENHTVALGYQEKGERGKNRFLLPVLNRNPRRTERERKSIGKVDQKNPQKW